MKTKRTVLDINGRFYEMNESAAIELITIGKQKLKRGIYGVYRPGYVRALLEKYDKEEDLKAAVEKYKAKGFTVLFNNAE